MEEIENKPRESELESQATSTGLNANFAAALCYLLGFVTGLLLLFLEKQNSFVRFHAIQSIITWVTFWVVYLLVGWIPVLNILVVLAGFILWLTLILKAYRGERFRVPLVAAVAEKNS
jgi:uncharacterized membrane protein